MIRAFVPIALLAVLPCQAQAEKEKEKDKAPEEERETSTGRIIDVEDDDAGMNAAMAEARKEFPAFWKAISEDRKKAEPKLEPAMVKVEFSDPGKKGGEHLWIKDVSFDGKLISGEVASEPHDLKSVKLGQKVSFPLEQLSDWLYVENGVAKGASPCSTSARR
jgi:uncharacterized protein YegJ (DUF2314 family)